MVTASADISGLVPPTSQMVFAIVTCAYNTAAGGAYLGSGGDGLSAANFEGQPQTLASGRHQGPGHGWLRCASEQTLRYAVSNAGVGASVDAIAYQEGR